MVAIQFVVAQEVRRTTRWWSCTFLEPELVVDNTGIVPVAGCSPPSIATSAPFEDRNTVRAAAVEY